MLSEVTTLFNKAIRDAVPSNRANRDEVIRFIDKHERKNVCVLNLCREVETAESRFGARLGVKRRDFLIKECAKMFVHAAMESWHIQSLSLAEKSRIINRDSKYDEIRSCIKEKDPDEPIEQARPIGGDSRSEGAGLV